MGDARKIIITAVGLVLILGGLIIVLRSGEKPVSNEVRADDALMTEVASVAPRPERVVRPAPVAAPEPEEEEGYVEPGGPPEYPEPEGLDPEMQPRQFYVRDFRGIESVPAGFQTHNLELTNSGFRLLPPEPGKENEPRMGILESPIEAFDFPSNAVAPLWMENIPDGTDVVVEFQVSPDASNWGAWQHVGVDEDSDGQMNEYYPDGRPNPNYGYTPGGVYVWGDLQWMYVRYRATLYSDGPESPELAAFRLFYQDSTLGEGYLAQLEPEQADTTEPLVVP